MTEAYYYILMKARGVTFTFNVSTIKTVLNAKHEEATGDILEIESLKNYRWIQYPRMFDE